MLNKHTIIYLILLSILAILVIATSLIPRISPISRISPASLPTPTTVVIIPSPPSRPLSPSPPSPTILSTNTGVYEDIPATIRDVATQKQALRKKTPLKQAAFTIEFNYTDDNFIITLNEPRTMNHELFNSWLKQNYPLIPASEFVFK